MLVPAKENRSLDDGLHVTHKDIFRIDTYVRRDCALVCHTIPNDFGKSMSD